MAYAILPPLKKLRPYNIISFDTEFDEEGKFYVGTVYGKYKLKEINQTFYTLKEFEAYLFKRRWSHTILIGMNVMVELNQLMFKDGFNWDILQANTNFITAIPPKETKKLYHNSCLKIIDLHNFFPTKKLKNLVESFNHPHIYIDKHMLGVDGNLEEMIEACMSHSKAGYLCGVHIQKFYNMLGTNIEITPALSSQCLHRRCYLPKKAQILGKMDPVTPEQKMFHKSAYYGGRTEQFIHNTNVDEVAGIDVNSLYPFVMRNNPFPDLTTYRECGAEKPETLIKLMCFKVNGGFKYEGLAKVTVVAPEKLELPVLCYIDNSDTTSKLLFPRGEFTGSWAFPVLRKALELGYKILDVFKIGYAKPLKADLFKAFVDGMYGFKQDPAFGSMAKLTMNSLYGKFGQKANEKKGWQPCKELPSNISNLDPNKFRVNNGVMFEFFTPSPPEILGFSVKAYPLIAAYVTCYAQLVLYNAMEIIGLQHIYYCDTDSIYCDQTRLAAVSKQGLIDLDPVKLGAWDVEHYDCDLSVRGLKYYKIVERETNEKEYSCLTHDSLKPEYITTCRIKGVPTKHHKEYWKNRKATYDRFVKYAYGVRNNLTLNTQYSFTREDQNPQTKRLFISPYKSIPLVMTG